MEAQGFICKGGCGDVGCAVGSESEMRSSSTLDCAVDVDGLDVDAALLPFPVLSALEVRMGTAVLGSCKDGCADADAAAVPLIWELLAARNAETATLGNGGALALARCCASLQVDGMGAVRDRAMLLASVKGVRESEKGVESTGDLGAA